MAKKKRPTYAILMNPTEAQERARYAKGKAHLLTLVPGASVTIIQRPGRSPQRFAGERGVLEGSRSGSSFLVNMNDATGFPQMWVENRDLRVDRAPSLAKARAKERQAYARVHREGPRGFVHGIDLLDPPPRVLVPTDNSIDRIARRHPVEPTPPGVRVTDLPLRVLHRSWEVEENIRANRPHFRAGKAELERWAAGGDPDSKAELALRAAKRR